MGRDGLGRLLDAGYGLVLADGFALAKCLNVGHGSEGAGAFGVVARPVRSWIEGLWELWGDGRTFVSGLQRQMVLREVLVQGGFECQPHLPAMLGRYLSHVRGLPGYERAIRGGRPEGLTAAEGSLLDCLAAYDGRLRELGFVEPGEAQLRLAEAIGAGEIPERAIGGPIAYVSDAPMAPDLEAFFEDSGLARTVDRFNPDGARGVPGRQEITAAPEGVEVSFAFPSGVYAEPQLLLSLIERQSEGPSVVSARDPLRLYRSIVPGLAARGLKVAVKGRKPFAETALGAAFLTLRSFLADESRYVPKSELADVLSTPLLRLSKAALWDADKAMRSSRLSGKRQLVEEFLARRPDAGDVEDDGADARTAVAALLYEVVAAPSRAAMEALREAVMAYPGPEGLSELGYELAEWKSEQRAAVDAIDELFTMASALGVPVEDMSATYAEALASSSLPVRYATFERAPLEEADVLVTTLEDASAPRVGRPRAFFVCDADAASYPAAERDDACSRLFFGALGLPRGEERLSRLRRTWNRLLRRPTERFVVLRNLNDPEGNPTYPCSMVEEFVDCHRDLDSAEARAGRDLDKIYLLPERFRANVETLGEQDLPHDVLAGVEPPVLIERPASSWRSEDRTWVVPRDARGAMLSPTEIDDYRACPYGWFITRRLASYELDQDFSPRERGSMLHDVFDRFYDRMRKRELYVVREDNLDRSHQVMDEVFDEEVARRMAAAGSGESLPYSPLPGTTEEAELLALRPAVHQWVDAQAELTAFENDVGGESFSFVPRAFEFDLAPYGVEYAGVRLNGRVDRIDTDWQRGMATVVDYKGTMTKSAYEPKVRKGRLDGNKAKLQALIYASAIQASPAIRRKLELRDSLDGHYIRGAIYSSYKKGFQRAGTLLKDSSEAAKEAFDEDLSVIEAAVREGVVEPMAAGEVPRRPVDKSACLYCPVLGCPKRLS